MGLYVVKRKFMPWVMALSLACLTAGPGVYPVLAAGADKAQEETAEEEDKAWTEDLDKKLDVTIQMLNVIREELKDVEADTGKKPQDEKDWVVVLRENIGKISRLWRKLRKVTEPGSDQTKIASEDEARLTRDLSDRLNETIEAMKIMKEELDKIQSDRTE